MRRKANLKRIEDDVISSIQNKSSLTSKLARCSLFLINIILLLFGIGIIVAAIYLLQFSELFYGNEQFAEDLVLGLYFILVGGCVMIFISFCGLCAISKGNVKYYICYQILVTLTIIIVSIGVLVVLLGFQDKMHLPGHESQHSKEMHAKGWDLYLNETYVDCCIKVKQSKVCKSTRYIVKKYDGADCNSNRGDWTLNRYSEAMIKASNDIITPLPIVAGFMTTILLYVWAATCHLLCLYRSENIKNQYESVFDDDENESMNLDDSFNSESGGIGMVSGTL